MQKVAGALSIHGHDVPDDQWHPACSIGSNLIALECTSNRRVKYSSELLSSVVDNRTRKAIQVKLRKNNDVGCIIYLKANRFPSRLQCQELFDISSITVSIFHLY